MKKILKTTEIQDYTVDQILGNFPNNERVRVTGKPFMIEHGTLAGTGPAGNNTTKPWNFRHCILMINSTKDKILIVEGLEIESQASSMLMALVKASISLNKDIIVFGTTRTEILQRTPPQSSIGAHNSIRLGLDPNEYIEALGVTFKIAWPVVKVRSR